MFFCFFNEKTHTVYTVDYFFFFNDECFMHWAAQAFTSVVVDSETSMARGMSHLTAWNNYFTIKCKLQNKSQHTEYWIWNEEITQASSRIWKKQTMRQSNTKVDEFFVLLKAKRCRLQECYWNLTVHVCTVCLESFLLYGPAWSHQITYE